MESAVVRGYLKCAMYAGGAGIGAYFTCEAILRFRDLKATWEYLATSICLVVFAAILVLNCFNVVTSWREIDVARRTARRSMGLCGGCGYNLTGNVGGICPECGEKISDPVPSTKPPKI